MNTGDLKRMIEQGAPESTLAANAIVTWKLSPHVWVHFVTEHDLQFVLRMMPQGPVFAVNSQEARHLLTLLSARAENGH